MDTQVHTKLSEQRERLKEIKSSWSVFASRCKEQAAVEVKNRPAHIVNPMEKDLWTLWNSISAISTMQEKLKALKTIAYRQYARVSKKKLRRKRKKFDRRKRSILRIRGSECFVCGAPAQVRHHVIQLQNGGHNADLNVIPVCRGCHASIHPWMDA
jgi:HNH endonuclease